MKYLTYRSNFLRELICLIEEYVERYPARSNDVVYQHREKRRCLMRARRSSYSADTAIAIAVQMRRRKQPK